jgi:DNA-binding CsgD family transcriptional regulator
VLFLSTGGAMRAYIVVMEAVAVFLLIGLAGWLARASRRGPHGAFRLASAGAAAACALLGITSFQHLLHAATRGDLVGSGWGDLILGPLSAARATIAVLVAALAVTLWLRCWTNLARAQSMVDALTDRLPAEAVARQADLSTRELEVLGLIRMGVLSTDDIARSLCISPATAATHVQNILKKTALHSRRDLMLLPPVQPQLRRANA